MRQGSDYTVIIVAIYATMVRAVPGTAARHPYPEKTKFTVRDR
ncbi:hypothetical protein EDF58_103441 [Novosphingobium sp. PhB57]|nr:hypothetical protein EDF58_103441 [Novosphingobium sp. PhB57]